jgi:hypothetical protein
MKLIDYVGGCLDKKSSAQQQQPNFPADLELPAELITDWHNLYLTGEQQSCEYGESLTLDTGFFSTSIKRSEPVKGNANSCDPPRTTKNLEFGDMHSHPTFSIGHVNGYSPHSIEDWMVFQHHTSKPVFIRFVASGHYLYAVVYRNGVSNLLLPLIDSSLTFHTQKMEEYAARFNLKEKKKKVLVYRHSTDPTPILGDDEYEVEVDAFGHELRSPPSYQRFGVEGKDKPRKLVPYVDPILDEQEVLAKKKSTPGLGDYMMKLAGLNNVELAKRLNFGFYVGHREKDNGLLRLTDKWTYN